MAQEPKKCRKKTKKWPNQCDSNSLQYRIFTSRTEQCDVPALREYSRFVDAHDQNKLQKSEGLQKITKFY